MRPLRELQDDIFTALRDQDEALWRETSIELAITARYEEGEDFVYTPDGCIQILNHTTLNALKGAIKPNGWAWLIEARIIQFAGNNYASNP